MQPISNRFERLFNKYKLTLGYFRKGMSPMNLEMIMFLNINKDL